MELAGQLTGDADQVDVAEMTRSLAVHSGHSPVSNIYVFDMMSDVDGIFEVEH